MPWIGLKPSCSFVDIETRVNVEGQIAYPTPIDDVEIAIVVALGIKRIFVGTLGILDHIRRGSEPARPNRGQHVIVVFVATKDAHMAVISRRSGRRRDDFRDIVMPSS